ncbi:MAG: NAD kinase [Clostridium sp.]|nr:NAD kinase [Clostridium sp.]
MQTAPSSRFRIALFGNAYQAGKSASLQTVLAQLDKQQVELYVDRTFHDYITSQMHLAIQPDALIDNDDFEADLAVSMGGDGTFLEAARRVGNKGIPIVGVNTGRLGFLADISPAEIEATFEQIFQGNYTVEERSLLQATAEGDPLKGYPFALNEVAVLKRDHSSMISIRVEVDGEYLVTYQADGLVINTPTGSTGYALSVGGPIIAPQTRTFGLAPVAPHSLNIRPITLCDSAVISLTVESRSHNFLVAIDGRNESCRQGTRLILRKAPYHIKVCRRPSNTFFSTLRQKLMWGADARE